MHRDELASRIQSQLPAVAEARPCPEARLSPPPEVLDHEILRKIGSGCYGDVWLARNQLGHFRAVKAVWRHAFSSDRPFEREFRGMVEFEPLSRSHPGVISILHVGRDDRRGCFYYVMELADDDVLEIDENDGALRQGEAPLDSVPVANRLQDVRSTDAYRPRSLRSELEKRGRLPMVEVLTLGVQLSDALGHLHRHGLVHRDVKPSNVVYVRGHPNLADIGLVTGSDEAHSLVGTAGFIPPEGQGSARGDVFSLGRLLYEAATGRDRCEYPSLPEDLDGWPAAERNALLELNEVLARMCAPNISMRHENVAAVAGDLNLILSGRSVRHAYTVERRLRRATRVIAAAAALIAVAAGVLWLLGMRQHEISQRATMERTLRQRAEAAEQLSRQQLYTALLEQARANRLTRGLGQRVVSLEAIRRASTIANTPELRREALAAVLLPDLRLVQRIPVKPEQQGRAFDPSFNRYALSEGRGPVEIRETSDGRLLATLPATVALKAFVMEWSPDGKLLAVKRDGDASGTHGDLELWDWEAQCLILSGRDQVTQNSLTFHPSKPWLATANAAGRVTVWNAATGRALWNFQVDGLPWSLRYSPDGEQFALSIQSGADSRLEVRDARTGDVMTTDPGPRAHTAEWHPHGHMVAVPDDDGNVRLTNLETGSRVTLSRHKRQAVMAAFSPDGRYLITGGWEAEMICWDLQSLRRAFTIGLNSWRLRFNTEGSRCAVEINNELRIYDFQMPSGTRDLLPETLRGCVYGAFSADGRWFSANRDDGFAVWDLQNPSPAAVIKHDKVRIPVFAPSGDELYVYREALLTRWRLERGNDHEPPRIRPLPVISPPGLLTVGFLDHHLIATGQTGTHLVPLNHPQQDTLHHIMKAAGWSLVSPDQQWLAVSAAQNRDIQVLRLPALEAVASLRLRSRFWTLAFAPHGKELVVGTPMGLEFFDTTTWQRTRELALPSERQSKVLYAPDGRTFWHVSDGRTASLRDTQTLEPLLPLPEETLPLALSADGRKLAVSVNGTSVQILDLPAIRLSLKELGADWPTP
jgi:WD40 repeat protein/serine/threonine protein kinase